MDQITQAINEGYTAFQSGQADLARRKLANVHHPKAWHVLALVEKQSGNLDQAGKLLDKASQASPNDHEIAYHQGTVANLRGDLDLAENAFRRALSIASSFMPAHIALGRLCIDQERWDEAETIYTQLMKSHPDSVPVRYGLATVQLGLSEAETAERILSDLITSGNDKPQIRFMRARARLESGDTEPGLEDLYVSYNASPQAHTLSVLAATLWMTGQQIEFDRIVTDAIRRPQLTVTGAEILRQSGDPERCVKAMDMENAGPDGLSVAALAFIDLNQGREAEAAASRCLAALPEHRVAKAALITALLMQGKISESFVHIREMRAAEPLGQHWIAYEATALRQQGSPEYGSLVDLDRFVRAYTLPTPKGFWDLAEFNAEFIKAIAQWHLYQVRPLDQTLRHGIQTPKDLITIDDPVVQAYIAALDQPIRQYLKDVGTGPEHPLTRRSTGQYKIAGCWSVRLSGQGRHVNHVHPEGWISSAYYLAVPQGTADDPERAGWIKFGEPPFTTTPPTPAQKWIAPKAGQLVLFPSFLWHGTQPIHDGEERITAPFDVVPI